jgi:hypothetical protein
MRAYTPASGMTKEAFRLWYAARYAKMSTKELQSIFDANRKAFPNCPA